MVFFVESDANEVVTAQSHLTPIFETQASNRNSEAELFLDQLGSKDFAKFTRPCPCAHRQTLTKNYGCRFIAERSDRVGNSFKGVVV